MVEEMFYLYTVYGKLQCSLKYGLLSKLKSCLLPITPGDVPERAITYLHEITDGVIA